MTYKQAMPIHIAHGGVNKVCKLYYILLYSFCLDVHQIRQLSINCMHTQEQKTFCTL